MEPTLVRRAWRTLEPYHGLVYFAAEAEEEYGALGLAGRTGGYFASRAAAMGAVTADVVEATFFNFSRRAVEAGMAGVWDKASPDQLLAARYRVADRALRRACGDLLDAPQTEEAAALARTACAGARPAGRPLYAAHAGLPWPDAPHLQLWHAATLLREHRGDGHVAALVLAGLDAAEACVLHVALLDGALPRAVLQGTRQHSDAEWEAAQARLQDRGWLDGAGALTPDGRARRQQVEDQTDLAALAPWQHLGEEGTARLVELVRPLSRAVRDSGVLPG